MIDFLIFLGALVLVIKSADMAMHYSSHVAKDLNISKHLVGFLIVALISVLPELSIAIISSFGGEPSFGLGTLFGSNVADLTLVIAIVIFFAHKSIKVKSKIIKSNYLYILTMLTPLVLGLDGEYSRAEGAVLMTIGILFYVWLLKKDREIYSEIQYSFRAKNFLCLLGSMCLLLIGSYLTVKHGIQLANNLKISPILIGLLGVSLGTTLPELFFSLKAVKKSQYDLALGDILGTVITDAVIIVGLVALINPFVFPIRIIYVTGILMLLATMLLFYLMRTDRDVSAKEALVLVVFYLIFVATELCVNI